MMLHAFVLLLVGGSVTALNRECPPSDSITCSCEIRFGPSITCTALKSEDELNSNLRALKGYAIDRFWLIDLTVPVAKVDLLKGLHITHLAFDKVEVLEDTFEEGVSFFVGLEKTLEILEISNSFKKETHIKFLKLDHLERLKVIMMNDNKIVQIGNDWFPTGPKKLNTILLERNGIERLGDKAFQSLDGLQIFWLTGNPLSEISRSMFPSPAPLLEKIDISNNKITQLPNDLFTNMPSLYAVFIKNNLIHTISEEIWPSNLENPPHLYLDGNPLQCDEKLKWVCKVQRDTHTAKCDSPSGRKGILISGFCDMED